MGGRADEDEFGNAPEPVAPAEYIRALAAYQARRGGGAFLGGNRRYQDAGLTGAFRGLRVRGESPSDDDSGSESDGDDDRGMRVMGRATMKARSRALLEVKGGYRMGRNDENAIGRAKARGATRRRPPPLASRSGNVVAAHSPIM